jgi:hypothetical protein
MESVKDDMRTKRFKSILHIAKSVKVIGWQDFNECVFLCDVTFSADSQVREIAGFCECQSLCRIEIPSSVEIVAESGFFECPSLNEILFSIDSHLCEIGPFRNCSSLCRI